MPTGRKCHRYIDSSPVGLLSHVIRGFLTISSLKIKGQSGEDAVLCTANKTFAVRSVVLSNSILVVTPPPDASSLDFADDAVVIRDQVTEVLELTPAVPKVHTLSALLKDKEFDGDLDDDDGHAETMNRTVSLSAAVRNRSFH